MVSGAAPSAKKAQGRSLCAASGALALALVLALAGGHMVALVLWLPALEHRASSSSKAEEGGASLHHHHGHQHVDDAAIGGAGGVHPGVVHRALGHAEPEAHPGHIPPGRRGGVGALDVGWHHSGSIGATDHQQRLEGVKGGMQLWGHLQLGWRGTDDAAAPSRKLVGARVQGQERGGQALGRGSEAAEEQDSARLRAEEAARKEAAQRARQLSEQFRALRRVPRPPPPPDFANKSTRAAFFSAWRRQHPWPPLAPSYDQVTARNRLPPRNGHLPLGTEQPEVILVLYVHNRPRYLEVTLQALSRVRGIEGVLLVVSHDGQYPAVDSIIQGITFCRVKQIYAPWSPHLFNATFPAASPGDCQGIVERVGRPGCSGTPDHFGHYRSPARISLKHHWWWLMNTVWDGLAETRGYEGHLLFLEEDHYLFPNALDHARALIRIKRELFRGQCSFATLAPFNPRSLGPVGPPQFMVEEMGNIGYMFDRAVWRRIHRKASEFCEFDDYNWDVSLWRAVLGDWEDRWAVRWVRASAQHIGTCGLHTQGRRHRNGTREPCDTPQAPRLLPQDSLMGITRDASMRRRTSEPRTAAEESFLGWGGWGDERDRQLCLFFSRLYKGSGLRD